jgi:hypothetical protein
MIDDKNAWEKYGGGYQTTSRVRRGCRKPLGSIRNLVATEWGVSNGSWRAMTTLLSFT